MHGTDGMDAEDASSASGGADGYPSQAPASDADETAPQPVLTTAAMAEAAQAHAHQRPSAVHAGPPADEGTVPDADAAPHHHHEAEGGQASHLAPAHVLPRPRRRWGLVAGVVAAALLVVGGATAFALTRDGSPAAAPAATPSASRSVDVSDVDPTSAPGVGGGEPMLKPGQDTLVLGDSLGLTVYPWLADLLPDRYVSYEAEVGRTTTGTLEALKGMPESEIPPVVIVSSGTNDPTAEGLQADAAELLDYLGPDRCVVWVDVVRPGSQYDSLTDLNNAIDAAVEGRDNVSVLRWTDLVAQHTDWLGGDGIHPGQTGAEGRAEAFAAAAESCSALDPSAPVAKKQYLPSSVFYGPISGGGTASGSGSGSNGGAVQQPPATTQAPAPPAPTSAAPSPSRTQDPSPQPSTSSPPRTSAPPPPPSSEPPPPPPSSAQAQGPTPTPT